MSIAQRLSEISAELAALAPQVAALEAGPPPPPPPPPPPATRAPRTLINPSHSTYWAREDAFINHVLVTGRDDPATGSGYAQWLKNGLFDEASGRFVKLPTTGPLNIGIVRDGTAAAPAHYAGKWILDWEGDGDIAVVGAGAGAQVRVSPNRIEETYDPALHGSAPPRVSVTRIGAGGIANIRYYRAAHETLINAGQVFDPSFLADASRFDLVRPMDWTGVNGDYELQASDRPHRNRPVWFGGRVPDWALIRLAIDAGNALHLNAPGFLGVTKAVADMLRNKTGTQAERVAAVAAAYTTFTVEEEMLLWARAIVAELNAQNYPLNRPLAIEYDNEVWNFTFALSCELCWGIGRALNAQTPSLKSNLRTGYGWQSARLAKAFAQALAEGGRAAQDWTLIVGTQTADAAKTTDALAAVAAFGGTEPMSRYGVAATNYYSGGFNWRADNLLFGSAMTQAAWEAKWLADLAADRAGLWRRITDYLRDPAPKPQNVAWIGAQWRAHKAAAEAAGARFVGAYEGDSHQKMSRAMAANAEAVALFDEWHESADHGRVILDVAAEIKAIDPTLIMANYGLRAGGRSPSAPWIEGAPWNKSGGDDAAWDELTS